MRFKTFFQFLITFLIVLFFMYTFNERMQWFLPLPINHESDASTAIESSPRGLEEYIGKKATREIENIKVAKFIIKNKKIARIEVQQKTKRTVPFVIGESLSEISDTIVFNPVISFKMHKKVQKIELGEVQQNYQPIYKFSEKVFAIFDFSHESGKLQKITYLTATELYQTYHAYLVE